MNPERTQNLIVEAHHWEADDFTPAEAKVIARWLEVPQAQLSRRWAAIQGVSKNLYPGQRGNVQTFLRRGNVCTIAQSAGLGKLYPGDAEAEILTLYNRLIYGWKRQQQERQQRQDAPKPVEQLTLF